MRNLMLVCAGLALIGAIVSVNLWRELRVERATVAELRSLLPASAAAVDAPPMIMAAPRGAASAAPIDLQAVGRPDMGTPPGRPRGASFSFNERDMLKDPDYRKARLESTRMSMAQSYPGLAEELGLSSEEADQLFDLLAKQQLEMMENAIWMGDDQDGAAAEERMRSAREMQQRQQGELSALLGGKYSQWQDYQESRPARQRVDQLRAALTSKGQSLSEAQARPLLTAMVAEQKRSTQEMQELSRGYGQSDAQGQARIQEEVFKLQAESNQRLLQAANAHLNTAQLDALRAMLDSQLSMSRAMQRAQRQQAEAQGMPTPMPMTMPPPGPGVTIMMTR